MQREKISVSCVDTIHPPLRQYSDQRPRGFHIVYECSGVNVGSLCKKLKSESVDAEPALPRQESNDFERLGRYHSIHCTMHYIPVGDDAKVNEALLCKTLGALH